MIDRVGTDREKTALRSAFAAVASECAVEWDTLPAEQRRKKYASIRKSAAVSMLIAILFGLVGVDMMLHFAGYRPPLVHVSGDYYIQNRNNNGPLAFLVGYLVTAFCAIWFITQVTGLVAPRNQVLRQRQRLHIHKRKRPDELAALARRKTVTVTIMVIGGVLALVFGIFLMVITAA